MDQKLIELYRELHEQHAYMFERELNFSDPDKKSAVIHYKDAHAIFIDTSKVDTIAEETELIAHEAGHIATGTTHTVNSPFEIVAQHEYRANKWAVQKLVPREALQDAFARGYTEFWQVSEYLGRSETFIRLAYHLYHMHDMEAASAFAS